MSAPAPFGEAPSRSVGEGVYYSLRRNIVNLNLRPGEVLNLKDLSDSLGVSRTPVRDALIKLEKEGLVDVVPQKGTSVSRIDLKRVDEEEFLRESVESAAILRFLRDPDRAALARMEASLSFQRDCALRLDREAFMESDDDFHGAIFRAVGQDFSWHVAAGMSGHYRRVRFLSLKDRASFDLIAEHHQRILSAISSGEAAAVSAALRDHFVLIGPNLSALREEHPEFFRADDSSNFLLRDLRRAT